MEESSAGKSVSTTRAGRSNVSGQIDRLQSISCIGAVNTSYASSVVPIGCGEPEDKKRRKSPASSESIWTVDRVLSYRFERSHTIGPGKTDHNSDLDYCGFGSGEEAAQKLQTSAVVPSSEQIG